MALKPRVTRRTDTRGTVNREHAGLFEIQALKAAEAAGVPRALLHPSGWDGDPDDTTGFFAELIYRLGELPLRGPRDMADAEAILSEMVAVCRNLGVDHREAVPFDYPRFIRSLRNSDVDRYAEVAAAFDAGEDVQPLWDVFMERRRAECPYWEAEVDGMYAEVSPERPAVQARFEEIPADMQHVPPIPERRPGDERVKPRYEGSSRTWVVGAGSWSVPLNLWEDNWRQGDDVDKWVNDPERAEAEGAIKPAWMK